MSGKDKGKQGKVVDSIPLRRTRLSSKAVNMVTKHVKPRRQGEQLGGIVKAEGCASMRARFMLVCPKCDKPTRVAHKVEDGKKVRVCKHCGAELQRTDIA